MIYFSYSKGRKTFQKKGIKTMKIFKRIKIYFFLKNLGINRPWKASGDKNFITFG